MDRKQACRVCGKPGTGVHYGVLACEGCKAFYKRGVEKNIKYLCYFGNNCSTQASSRVRCKACRFRKCAILGMKVKGLELPEEIRALQKEFAKTANSSDQAKVWICPSIGTEVDISATLQSLRQCPENHGDIDSPTARRTDSCGSTSDDSAFNDDFSTISTSERAASSVSESSSSISGDEILSQLHDGPRQPDDAQSSNETFCLPEILPTGPRLAIFPASSYSCQFIPLTERYMGCLEENRQQISNTVLAVDAAVHAVFGDQIGSWTVCRDRAIHFGEHIRQPETTFEVMSMAVQMHNFDNVARVQAFANMLPGMNQLHPSSRHCTTAGWKWVLFWMIHHAPFLSNREIYITVGAQGYRYCRYWQEMMTEWPLLLFIYKFCADMRDINLTQTEQYLLMSVVMFEPGEDKSWDQSLELKIIHRHYADTLLHVVRSRCVDTDQLTRVCRKLERFFSVLKMVYRFHKHYFANIRDGCPLQLHDIATKMDTKQTVSAV